MAFRSDEIDGPPVIVTYLSVSDYSDETGRHEHSETEGEWDYLSYVWKTITVDMDVPDHSISLSAKPVDGGNVSGAGTFPHGSTQTVTATPNPGYAFVNWTENGNPVNSDESYTFH